MDKESTVSGTTQTRTATAHGGLYMGSHTALSVGDGMDLGAVSLFEASTLITAANSSLTCWGAAHNSCACTFGQMDEYADSDYGAPSAEFTGPWLDQRRPRPPPSQSDALSLSPLDGEPLAPPIFQLACILYIK